MVLKPTRDIQFTLAAAALCLGVLVGRGYVLVPLAGGAITFAVALSLWGLRLTLLLVAIMAFGAWRGVTTGFDVTDIGRHVGKKVQVEGVVADDPGIEDQGQAAFVARVTAINGVPASGSLRIYTATYQELQRGYTITANGKIKHGKGGVPGYISYAQLTIESRDQGWLERLRQRFLAAVHATLPDPLSGFGIGLLIGARAMIDQQLQDTLTAVGLSHLIAVSGYNLTILVRMVRRLPLRLSHFTVTALSVWLIGGFLLITGFSASIVRAALVSGLSVVTAYYGYSIRPLTLMAVPILVTVGWNPDYLLHDVGWQLSFLAFFGILVVAPIMQRRMRLTPNAITALAIESSVAQVMTVPLVAVIFGTTSLISPVSNLIILPVIPLAMLVVVLTGFATLASPYLGAFLGLPATGLLALLIGIIQRLALVPHGNVRGYITPATAVLAYAVVGVVAWVASKREKYLK